MIPPRLPMKPGGVDPDAAMEASEGPVTERAEGEVPMIPGKPMGTGDTIRAPMPKPGHKLRGPSSGRRVYDD